MAPKENPTVALNNYLQGKGRLTALTWEHKSEGPRHDPVWTSHCKVDGVEVSTGTGKTQNLAKEAAAEKAKTILEAQDQAAQNSESAT